MAPQDLAAYTIHLRVSELIMAQTDPRLFHHILRDLLANVFKYVPPQAEVRIEATQAEPSLQEPSLQGRLTNLVCLHNLRL